MIKSEQIAKAIKIALKKKEWNKLRLSQEAQVQPGTVTRWLSGKHNFTLKTLSMIEIILETQIIYIIKQKE